MEAHRETAGPTNIGGRIPCLVCHPTQPHRVWAGAAGGGVWHSPDAGRTWEPQWHGEDVLNVGALALDPADPQVLYCGTGEANLFADSYPGVGLYRADDSGQTWRLHAPCDRTGLPRRIGAIAVDPFDSRHLLVGGVGFGEMGQANDLGACMPPSTAASRGAARRSCPPDSTGVIRSCSRTRGVVYATVTTRGAASGVYRSRDGGQSWQQLVQGFGPTERLGRAALAISLSDPRVLYAIVADAFSGTADHVLGVFRTRNGGNTWTNVAGAHFVDEGQMSYGCSIAVHPTRSGHVLCGGVDLHLSTNGGAAWRKVTAWDSDRGKPDYAHADHHALVMPAAAAGRVYDANDGGIDVSEDGGLTGPTGGVVSPSRWRWPGPAGASPRDASAVRRRGRLTAGVGPARLILGIP